MIPRRKSIKLFALAGTTVLAFPQLACSQLSGKGKVRFGLLTDSHYADRKPGGTRFYRDAKVKMQAAIAELNTQELDFLIHLGDFKDEDLEQQPEDTLRYLKEIEDVFQGFDGDVHHALGNHDMDSITKDQFLSHINNTGQEKAKGYYSFDKNGIHFILLDANYDAQGNDHFFTEGADWQSTHIPPVEMQWLRKDLSSTELPTVIFCHHPLYEYYKRKNIFHVNNHEEIRALLESSGKVMAAFHGHVHQEDFQQINGIHYVTQLGMVDYEGLENNSFSVVELAEGNCSIHGFKRATSKSLKA